MTSLGEGIRARAAATWRLLGEARASGTSFREDSLTDLNLHYLVRKHASEITIRRFNQREERFTGADWEWWFAGPRGTWIGMRVQAKILDLETGRFEHLFYKRNGALQVDTLIRAALSSSTPTIPAYVFYGHWPARTARIPWPCTTFRRSSPHFGCSVASAVAVRRLHGATHGNALGAVMRHALPWHCIFCCPPRATSHVDPVERVHAHLSDLMGLDFVPRTGIRMDKVGLNVSAPPTDDDAVADAWASEVASIKPTEERPWYVDDPPARDSDNVPQDLAGVVIVRAPSTSGE